MPSLGRNKSQSCKKLCIVTQRFDETLLVQLNTPVIHVYIYIYIYIYFKILKFLRTGSSFCTMASHKREDYEARRTASQL